MKDQLMDSLPPAEAAPLDKALMAAIDKALDPEKMQSMVEDALGDVVERWVKETVGRYDSETSRAFHNRMSELLVPAIERMSLDNARLDLMLAELVKESAVGERALLLKNFGEVMLGEQERVVRASALFGAWCEDVAGRYDCSGREVVDGEYATLECCCEFEHRDRRLWSNQDNAVLQLYVVDCDEEQEERINREISLYRWGEQERDEGSWYVHYPVCPEIGDLAHMESLDVMLARMSMYGSRIVVDVPTGGICEDVEPKEEPQYELV